MIRSSVHALGAACLMLACSPGSDASVGSANAVKTAEGAGTHALPPPMAAGAGGLAATAAAAPQPISVQPSAAGTAAAAPAAIASTSAAGAVAASAVAGMRAPAPVAPTAGGAAAGATGSAGAAPKGPGSCPGSELCQTSTIGGFKFCAPMMQALPPTCTAANMVCGSDMKGTCFDAAAVGFAGMLYCLHLTCM